MNKPAFNFRRFISCCEMVLFIMIIISGVALFIAPSTKIAVHEQWRFLQVSKFQWQALHTIASIIFLLFGLFHVYYNRKALKNYIVKKHLSLEFVGAVILGGVIAFTAFKNFYPVSKIMYLNWKFRHPAIANSHDRRGYNFMHRRF